MRLDDYIDELEPDEDARRRRLAEEKSYEVTEYLEEVEREFERSVQGDSLFGSTAPSVFVGRSSYPRVSTGILSPVAGDADPTEYATDGDWYDQGLGVGDVLRRRTGLLNSTRSAAVDVNDVWDGFVGVQREVAMADRPVDVEIGLDGRPDLDLDVGPEGVRTPTGPRASATDADLAENPHVPRPVKKTLEDDDWQAEGAMTYLYRRGFDVYDINSILSAGALGRGENRRLVPTRWSITAVDDTVGRYLRGQLRNAPSVDRVEVHETEYVGNRYWVVLAPGRWEFELVEMKAPGSVWNPTDGAVSLSAASEGYEGRSGYVEETAGAYYAARLGVLEHLADRGRQAKALVLREVTDDYWAPVGVWQIRESVRDAFGGVPGGPGDRGLGEREALAGEHGTAETFHGAVDRLTDLLPVSAARLRRKSELVAGLQTGLEEF